MGTVILTKKKKQHASPGDDASTDEAAPGSVGRGEQGEARRTINTHTKRWTSSEASSFTAQNLVVMIVHVLILLLLYGID